MLDVLWMMTAMAQPPPVPALQVGTSFEARVFSLHGGGSQAVPDPDGDYVVLELIRSADW